MSSQNPYEEVTDRILAELEVGVLPWARPWSETPGFNVPCNVLTGRAYSGVNKLLLWLAHAKGWPTPRFVTFRQARERKGEHGTRIYYVGDWHPKEELETAGDEGDGHTVRFLKRFVVFNVSQCDDLPAEIADLPLPKPQHHDGRIPLIEEFIATTGADIREGADRASYLVTADRIAMPPFATFTSANAFYDTLFHEIVHWTGHRLRLDRNLAGRFDDPRQRYAAEELIAELGAAFLCAEFSINNGTDHSSYIGGWIGLLRSDPKAIFTCASAAQKAVDFLRELALREPMRAAE